MAFRNYSLRRKVVAIIMLVSGIVAALICAVFFLTEFVGFRRTTVDHLATLGRIIAANSTAALAFNNPADAREVLSALSAEPQFRGAALFDARGRLFASLEVPAGAPIPAEPGRNAFAFGSGIISGFVPVTEGGKSLGTLYISFGLDALYQRLWVYVGIIALLLTSTFLLSYALSNLLQAQISRPVLDLAAVARRISKTRDYSMRATQHGADEIGELAASFNAMIAEVGMLHRDLELRVADRTSQLEAANRELEAFSYSVSHDLRAPLRHVNGFAGLLEKHAGPALDAKGRRYLDVIAGAARQMGRLIDDLLAFSRINRTNLTATAVDHDSLMAGVLREGRYEIAGGPVAWKIGPLPAVRADPAMLRQVWSNLIDNAVKYSGKSPHPRIEIGALPAAPDSRERVFFVRDNGVGFDMKYAGKLFGVFQRLHSAEEFEGTGIGLANVQRIVLRHGGRVWAEGEVGKGAAFYFSLPGAPEPPAPADRTFAGEAARGAAPPVLPSSLGTPAVS